MTGNIRFPQKPPRALDHSSQKHLPLLLSIALSMVFGAMNQTAQGASPPAGAEWTTHGGTLEGNRFSGLTEITPQNAKTLKEEFTFTTGVKGSHMGAPLVVGSTLYVATPYPNKVLAYDLSSGKTLWTYAPSTNQFAKGVNCCDTPNRASPTPMAKSSSISSMTPQRPSTPKPAVRSGVRPSQTLIPASPRMAHP